MSRARVLVYALVALSMLFTAACNRGGDAKGELQKKYDSMNAALKAKNVKEFVAPLADDFQQVYADKTTVGRAKIEELTNDFSKTTSDIDSKSTIEQVSVSGERADVTVTTVQKATAKEPTTDKTHVIEITSTSTDVWKSDKGDWKLVQSTETKHVATMDGQPMPTTKTAPKK